MVCNHSEMSLMLGTCFSFYCGSTYSRADRHEAGLFCEMTRPCHDDFQNRSTLFSQEMHFVHHEQLQAIPNRRAFPSKGIEFFRLLSALLSLDPP
jgi:hypothetical protein